MAQECCDTGEKDIQKKVVVNQPENKEDKHSADDGHNHDEAGEDSTGWKAHWDLLLALLILAVLLVLLYAFKIELPKKENPV